MSTHARIRGICPDSRKPGSRFAIALLGAIALVTGPGAWAAHADAQAPADPVAVSAAPVPEPAAGAAPAPEPAPAPIEVVPLPVPEPVVAQEPVIVPEPAPAAEPVPVPEPVVVPEPAAAPAPEPAAELAPEPITDTEPAEEPVPADAAAEGNPAPDHDANAPAAARSDTAAAPTAVKPGNANPHVKVRICHATGTNKWVTQWPNANGDVSGHAGHQDGRDIIPSFQYNEGGTTMTFPGQNMDAAGAAVYNNDCATPEEPPEPGTPTIQLTPPPCRVVDGDLQSTINVTVGGENLSGLYTLTVSQDGAEVDSESVAGSGLYSVSLEGLGEYIVSISKGETELSWTSFTYRDCGGPEPASPTITLAAPGCVDPEDPVPAEITVTVSGSDALHEYTLTIMDGSGWSDAAAVDHDGGYTVDLHGIGSYTVVITEGETAYDTEALTIEACNVPPPMPAISVAVDQCTAPGGAPGSTLATLTGLESGSQYSLTVMHGDAVVDVAEVTADGVSATVELAALDPGDYTATLTGLRSDGSWSATFTVAACPVVPPVTPPVAPSAATPPMAPVGTPPVVHLAGQESGLAVTGSDGWLSGGVVALSTLLLLGGVAVLRAGRRQRARIR